MKYEAKDQPKIINQLLESVNQASGACSQLIHMLGGEPRFILIREVLEKTKDNVSKIATINAMSLTTVKH